jgi:hypothetical protein
LYRLSGRIERVELGVYTFAELRQDPQKARQLILPLRAFTLG